ncbi:response regulator transcription factor [Mycoplasma sp. P36-A1]|uniref:response regulator transcription factor n=1 Tax=Mycoplasma sp. P36-A1 TaxID=3252900 RepID=UPI003C2D4016
MSKILIVEDDLNIQDIVAELLQEEGYEVKRANDGQQGYEAFKEGDFDLVITDVMMPIMDGNNLVKLIRGKDKNVKILMLTALGEEYDELKGFELGVDDYVAKPFSFNILLKRIEALLRRNSIINESTSKKISYDNIMLDDTSHSVLVEDNEVALTLKEFEILKILMNNVGKVISREILLDQVWGYSYYGDTRVIDTHIKNIRKKTGISKIKTVTGIGYKLEEI